MATSNRESSGTVKVFGYSINFFRELGRGAFGTVYEGSDDEGKSVAIKKVSKSERKKASTEAVKCHFLKGNVVHENIIKVFDVKRCEDSMWIVMEYCDFGDLNNFFHEYQQQLDTRKKLNIMGQISRGIVFLHNQNIVHRDIKPANILMKSDHVNVIVKLGDFGLCKVLDSDDMTSGMSSNVGAQLFKAPEFWDREPGGRVRYHRNVDVYAAGLTFTAMLQANSEHSLTPKAEGSLEPYETKLPIGLAAYARCQNKHSEIRIVVQHASETPLLNKLKSVIEAMTCLLPEARITAREVKKRIDALKRELEEPAKELTLISRFDTETSYYARTMCYVNNNPVITAIHNKTGNNKAKLYDETGSLLKEWEPCHGVSVTIGFQTQGKEYLLEGCRLCKVIRGCKFPQRNFKILYELIFPSCMCKGPDGTILVFERVKKSIKQLSYYEGQFHLTKQFFTEFEAIHSLCYSDKSGIVTVVQGSTKTIAGIHFPTGHLVWQHDELQLGSSSQALNRIQDILTLPDGRACIITYDAIFALDPVDGTILLKLLDLKDCLYLGSSSLPTWTSAKTGHS